MEREKEKEREKELRSINVSKMSKSPDSSFSEIGT